MSVSSALDEDKIGIEMSDIDLNDDSDPMFKKQHCNGHNNKRDYDQDTVYSIPVVQGIFTYLSSIVSCLYYSWHTFYQSNYY